jgi:hypothetical protein
MKTASRAFWILLAGLVAMGYAEKCEAQVARYQPRTSTVSPYLNLGRFNGGGLPNYYALVRPQLQQRQFNTQASQVAQLQAAEIASLQSQVKKGLSTPQGAQTGHNSWFMTPGTEHSFMNTSQFYPQKMPRRR